MLALNVIQGTSGKALRLIEMGEMARATYGFVGVGT
jgi:hypothetical protein